MKKEIEKVEYSFDKDLFRKRLAEVKGGTSNADLAQKTGVSAATIGNYINGNRTPRGFGDIVPIAKALNVSVDYLAGVCDYNYLDENKNDGASHPQNYYDVVKLINTLLGSFEGKTELIQTLSYAVRIEIADEKLVSFLNQQKQLYDMVGGPLSARAFNIALDDLSDKMRKTKLDTPICDISPEDIPF